MSVPVKLAGFAVVLAVVFGAAALVGSAADVHPGASKPAAGHGSGAMTAMSGAGDAAAAPQAVRGLAVSDHGLTLQLDPVAPRPGAATGLTFRIVDRRGRTVRDFDVEHTKRMHFIVVRRDMQGFQHLHPVQRADGSWTVPVTLRDAGTYRVFADFSVNGRPQTLADDLIADGTVRSMPLPPVTRTVTTDGLRVHLTEGASRAGAESELGFTVTHGGRPVAVQDYLGAKGHLVALREGDLAFLHVHPDEDRLNFMAQFPTAGRYRLFLQFKTEGRVHTAAFTQEVSR